jgi:hypothetical protein
MRTSFHHQPEAQHPNFPLSTSWQADYPIFLGYSGREMLALRLSHFGPKAVIGRIEIPQCSGPHHAAYVLSFRRKHRTRPRSPPRCRAVQVVDSA